MNVYLLTGDDINLIKNRYEFRLVKIESEKYNFAFNLIGEDCQAFQVETSRESSHDPFLLKVNELTKNRKLTDTAPLIAKINTTYEYLTSESTNALTRRVVEYFIERASKSTTLRKTATDLGSNEVKINQEFRKVYGFTAKVWLRKYKIYKACLALINTDTQISEISKELGFSASSNFTTIFQKEIGVSPKDLRKILK